MKYNYRGGVVEGAQPSFMAKLGLLTSGALMGLLAGLCVVYGQIQASVQPIVTAGDSSLRFESSGGRPVGVETLQGGEDNGSVVLQPAAGTNALYAATQLNVTWLVAVPCPPQSCPDF